MRRKGVAQSRMGHEMIQQRKISRVKHAVSETRDECGQVKSPNIWRDGNQEPGRRQQADAQTQNPMRTPSVDEKSCQSLTCTRYDEKHRHQRADLRIRQRVFA